MSVTGPWTRSDKPVIKASNPAILVKPDQSVYVFCRLRDKDQVNRGIVVNRHLETSAPDVYALGDCAEVEGLVLPFVMPIMHAARALAATLAGKPTQVIYPAMPVVVKTPACPTIVSPPKPVGSSSVQASAR